MEDINDAIANAYFADEGFRSVQHTYKIAKAENPAVARSTSRIGSPAPSPERPISEATTASWPARPDRNTRPTCFS